MTSATAKESTDEDTEIEHEERATSPDESDDFEVSMVPKKSKITKQRASGATSPAASPTKRMFAPCWSEVFIAGSAARWLAFDPATGHIGTKPFFRADKKHYPQYVVACLPINESFGVSSLSSSSVLRAPVMHRFVAPSAVAVVEELDEDIPAWVLVHLDLLAGAPDRYLVSDVTHTYLDEFQAMVKFRIDQNWWLEELYRWSAKAIPQSLWTCIERDETACAERVDSMEIPKTMNAIKNHPRYCMERFVTKYQAIHPKEPVGELHGEAIYLREHLHVLHTRDKWTREQREVMEDEDPFKTVDSIGVSLKVDKKDRAQSELFGLWQTRPLSIVVAKDGKVPKNSRGNVDLQGASSGIIDYTRIPVGCVLIDLPGDKRAAKQLDIDFAEAMIGFDVRRGRPVPIFRGIVICREFEQRLRETQAENQRLIEERAESKRIAEIKQTWHKVIHSLLVRQKIGRELPEEFTQSQPPKKSVKRKAPAPEARATASDDDAADEDPLHTHSFSDEEEEWSDALMKWVQKCYCGAERPCTM